MFDPLVQDIVEWNYFEIGFQKPTQLAAKWHC